MPNAVVKCLSRQEFQLFNSIKISLYRVVRDSSLEIPKRDLNHVQQLEASELVKFGGIKELCGDSDAVNIVVDGLSIFTHLRKVSSSNLQLLTVPSIVKSLQILRAPDGNEAREGSGEHQQVEDFLEAFGTNLKPEWIRLDEDLIAYDSSVDGILNHDFLALKVVGEGMERVIFKDELLASINRARSDTSSNTATKTRRGGKARRTRKKRGRRSGRGRKRGSRGVELSKARKGKKSRKKNSFKSSSRRLKK